MNQHLQQFSRGLADAASQEQVVENQEVGIKQCSQLLLLFVTIAKRVLPKGTVGLSCDPRE